MSGGNVLNSINSQGINPKRIAMLGSMPPIKALSSYCLELALAIADFGKVEFISFNKIYPTLFYPGRDLQDDHTFPSIMHPKLKIRQRLTWYNPLTWIIEGLWTNAELLHAQWWSLPLAFIYAIVCSGFKLRRKPVIITVHNVRPHEKSFLYDMVTRILFKLGNHFIVHSATNRAQLIEYYKIPPERVTQISHGPLDFYIQCDVSRDMVRKQMGFHQENRIILLFGSIRPYKGVDTALRAFAAVLLKIPEARLLIAGKLWEPWERYERLIEELGIGDHIKTYLGYIPSGKVGDFFTASDLVILPYHHFDAQSGVGAAAISFSKPIIVTDVGGLPDLVIDQRCVVPQKDPAALAQAIVNCFKNPSQLVAMSAGAKVVAAKMSWSAIATRTWSVYREVLCIPEKTG